jgi:hypothetical protein
LEITLNEILQAITTVGFPIVVSGFMLLKMNKTIENNTKVMTIIATKLGIEESEVK